MTRKYLFMEVLGAVMLLGFARGELAAQGLDAGSRALARLRGATGWRLYASSVSSPASVSLDSLKTVPFYPLDNDSVRDFLSGLSVLAKKREPVWMGMWVASYEGEDGQRHKVLVSEYGGFFMDVDSGNYFILASGRRDDWLKYLTACLSTLSGNRKN